MTKTLTILRNLFQQEDRSIAGFRFDGMPISLKVIIIEIEAKTQAGKRIQKELEKE